MIIYTKVLLSSILILFACLGLGRFGYGMILPNLQETLHLSTSQVGFIGTTNFIGYFVGITVVASLYKRYETSKLISLSLVLQSLSMFAMTFSTHYYILSSFYTLSGFFAAISNVSIMVYIAHIIPSHIKGKALGIIVTGNGMAIIFSGFLVPYIDNSFLNDSWEINWNIFALLTFLIALLIPFGLTKHDHKQQYSVQKNEKIQLLNSVKFYKIAFLYLIFGITYVIYVTFFVTAAIDTYNISLSESGYFWSLLGFMSLFSGPLFGSIADKIGAYRTLVIIYAFQTIANFILALSLGDNYLWISAVLFGLSAWAIPSLITLLSSQEFGGHNTTKVFSLATLIFAVGQVIGPLGAGLIYDSQNNFSEVFLLCASLTFLAACCSMIFSKTKQKNT